MVKFIKAVMIAACLLAAGAGFAKDALEEAKDASRRGIAVCDSKVKDELAPLAERRMMRDICDHMRKQFREKYGTAP